MDGIINRNNILKLGMAAVIAAFFVLSLALRTKNADATPGQTPSVSSRIELDPSGDLNHNGQVDGGDTLKFSYAVKNPTNKAFPFSSLETHIDSSKLNYIHNIKGVSSLDAGSKTIIFPKSLYWTQPIIEL